MSRDPLAESPYPARTHASVGANPLPQGGGSMTILKTLTTPGNGALGRLHREIEVSVSSAATD